MLNRNGDYISAQISVMGAISFSDGKTFAAKQPFNIKNDGDAAVSLEVRLHGMQAGEFITTRFETGWNPEIVAEVKPTSASGLFWGY